MSAKTRKCRKCKAYCEGKATLCELFASAAQNRFRGTCTAKNWPLVSRAAGVHPKQVAAAMEHAQKNGVPTEIKPSGEVVFRSREHRKKYLKLSGLRDNQGGYGD